MNRQTIGFLVRDDAGYDVDTAAWCLEQARLLRAGAFDAIDAENVAEEIESLGKEQANAIRSHLWRLQEHLLKLDASGDLDPRRGWLNSVREQRASLKDRLDQSPSLRRRLPEFADAMWPRAVSSAKAGVRPEEEAAVDMVPRYEIEKLLDESYFGERDAAA